MSHRSRAPLFIDAVNSEGPRLARLLADGVSTVFLGNHGVMVVGETVAEAFDELYYLERVCELHVLAMSTGRPLAIIADDIAELTCRQWLDYPEGAELHLRALLEILDSDTPGWDS